MSDCPTPAQIRGARGILGWSLLDLAKAASVSVITAHRAEHPEVDGFAAVGPDAVRKIQSAFETEGVRFLPDDGNGLGLRLQTP